MSSFDTQVGGDHYKSCKMQPLEYMLENNLGYVEGAVVKYVTRWRNKNGIQDLQKAKHLLEMLIEHEDKPVCDCGASGVDVDRCAQQHIDHGLPVPCISDNMLPEPLIKREKI